MISRFSFSVACAVLLVRCAALGGEPRKPETPLEKTKRLAASEEKKDRVQALRWFRALGKPGTARGDEALFRYAELCLRFHAEGEKGTLAEARRAYGELKTKSRSKWGIRGKIGLCRCAALEGRRLEAMLELDQFLLKQGREDVFVDAAYYLGCMSAQDKENLKGLKRARVAFNYALKLRRARGKYYVGLVTERDIRHRWRSLKHDIDRLALGEDFLLYRRAESLRRSGRGFKKALELYRVVIKKHPANIYAEASRLYAPLCLVGLKKLDGAQRDLWAFYQKDKNGLYRGEALLELGRIELEHRVRPLEARKYFGLLNKWFERARKEVPDNKMRIKPAARRLTAPPKAEKKADHWGNINKQRIRPGQLVNRRTCGWYLDDLEEQCAGFRGFIYFVEGKKEQALKCYEKILKYDRQTKRMQKAGVWNDYARLKWGAEHGYLYAYPEDLRLYRGRQRFVILLADFYYCTERFDKARDLAERLLANEFGNLRTEQKIYPHVLIGSALYRTKGRKAAFLAFEKGLKAKRICFSRDRLALIAVSVSARVRDIDVHLRGHECLKKLAFSGRRNRFVYEAMIEFGLRMFYVGRDAEGKKMLLSLPRQSGGYRELAKFYLKEHEEKRKQKEVGPDES